MGEVVSVRLLGQIRISQDGREVVCSSRKALALFAYLALEPVRHTRAALAALLWDPRDMDAARTSLRTALQRLPAPLHALLDIRRDTISLRPQPALMTDVQRFESLVQSSDTADPNVLEEAVSLVDGELLAGFDADATPAFDDWLHAGRTRMRQLLQTTFDRLIAARRQRALLDAAKAAVERAQAMAAARRWLQIDPAAEAAHRWLMQLHVDAGQTGAALEQYELCRRALAVAYGRAPQGATRELYDALLASGSLREPAPPALAPGDLQRALVPATSFVGRIEELAQIDALLADPHCRLLALHGLGGVGKTRLAHMAAQQASPRFAQGVSWVALEPVSSAAAVAEAVAQALGIEAAAARAGAAQAVGTALARQQRLIVLDNLEQLLADAPQADALAELLLQWLRQAPALKLMTTSRQVLGLAEEWVFQVPGLPLPPSDTPPPGGAAAATGALELFFQRARQAYLGFSPAAEWPHALRLCRLVDGLPLAIELVAAWVRTVPCGELVRAVEAIDADLAHPLRERQASHRSLDAVIAHSWSLLDGEQQRVLAALSVFADGFGPEAARAVADAPLRLLSGLVDKALLQRRPDGRLSLHPLVRRHAAARLRQRGESEALRSLHAGYFADLLLRCHGRLDGPHELEAEDLLSAERAELMQAAAHWAEHGPRARQDAVAEPLLRLLLSRGRFRDVQALVRRWLELPGLSPAAAVSCRTQWARASTLLGEIEAARAQFAEAIRLGEEHGVGLPLDRARVLALAVDYELGHHAEAMRAIEALSARAAQMAPEVQMRLLYAHAIVNDAAGELTRAEALARQALDIARAIGSPVAVATVESSLATVLLKRGQAAEATPLLRSALAVFERIGRLHDIARLSNTLAVAGLWAGELPTAEAAARRALAVFSEIGYAAGQSAAGDTLGQILLRQGARQEGIAQLRAAADAVAHGVLPVEARFHLSQALIDAAELDAARVEVQRIVAEVERDPSAAPAIVRYALLAAALLARDRGRTDTARALAEAVLADPHLEHDLREQALSISGAAAAAAGTAPSWSQWRERVADVVNRD
jgi:predicted ATPase